MRIEYDIPRRNSIEMNTSTLAQPEKQLGPEIESLLGPGTNYSRIVFVSAFAALRTVLRLRDRLLAAVENGTVLRLTVGIDLGGTSREVLEELVAWNCEVFVYHNPIVRATFHPKVYLFETRQAAVLFIGSNNLTDGGLYTNYEAATRYSFEFPPEKRAHAKRRYLPHLIDHGQKVYWSGGRSCRERMPCRLELGVTMSEAFA